MCAYDFVMVNESLPAKCINNKSPLINASKGVYCLRQDAISNQVNHVDLTWSRVKHDGLTPLHLDDIISHFIMNLFQEYA
jgi:hypothetical protein